MISGIILFAPGRLVDGEQPFDGDLIKIPMGGDAGECGEGW